MGKSIRRNKLEDEIGDLIKQLEPKPGLITVVKAMFRKAWDMLEGQAAEAVKAAKHDVKAIETEIGKTLDLIMGRSSSRVIKAYERKVEELEAKKALMAERATYHTPPKRSMDENIDPLLQFITNSWKIREKGRLSCAESCSNLPLVSA